MSIIARTHLLGLFVCGTAFAIAAAGQPVFTPAAGGWNAVLPDGSVLWRVRSDDPAAALGAASDGRAFRLNDCIQIDHLGCVAVWPDPGDGPPASLLSRTAAWDTPFPLTPPPPQGTSDYHNPPFFDSAGNAWVIITHIAGTQYALQLRRSNGHSGTWGPLEMISNSTTYVAGPEGTIDAQDNVTIAFRDISGGQYKLYAIRYEPGSGWGPLQMVYGTSLFWQAVEIGSDSAGNVVAVFDPNFSWNPSAWTVVRDAATGTWGAAQRVSPTGCEILLPTILQNATGDALYLIYLVTSGGPVGLYAHRFDSATRSFGPGQLLPGSTIAGFQIAGPESRLPGVVDAHGDATVFWENAYPGPYAPYASHTQDGVWQPADQLLPRGDTSEVENFMGAAVNPAGDVFGVATRYEDNRNKFYAFLRLAGETWQVANPYSSNVNLFTRTRVAFYLGRKAVATVLGSQGSQQQITSLLYDGGAWQPSLLDIPGVEDAFFDDLVADRGETLFVYQGEVAGVSQGIRATFLRAPISGDADCDGEVNNFDITPFVLALTDPSAYYATYGCVENCDCNGDGAVDNFDITPFVALLAG